MVSKIDTGRVGHPRKELGVGLQSRRRAVGVVKPMRTERMIAVLITIWAWSSIETGQVAAQDAPQPPLPSSVIPLERTEVSTPEAVSTPPPPVPQAASPVDRRQVRPSRQAGSPGGQAAVGQLRNPFESGGGHGGTPANRVASLAKPV